MRVLRHSLWTSRLVETISVHHNTTRSGKLGSWRSFHTSHHVQSGLRVAVVGSGPAGFYAARRLISKVQDVGVDMYEQLPVPFGLVRFGVAPDHPEVKNCQDTFGEVAETPNFNFIGNVNLGHELPLTLLRPHYHAILFAYGASKDRELGLKGESTAQHIYSARAFVGWYNGLPEYRDLNPDLASGEDAIIIGQGNVALDVARTLLTDVGVLRKTDITDHALQVLSNSRIKNVRVVGRRGPLQAAFTIKEVRELMQLPDTQFKPINSALFPSDLSCLPRPQKRLMQLLQAGSPNSPGAHKTWSLDFLLTPHSLHWASQQPYELTHVEFTKNVLADPMSPTSSLLPQSEPPTYVNLKAFTLFRSIGYKSEPLPGLADLGIPFDKAKGIIPNDVEGRILARAPDPKPDSQDSAAKTLPGLYCTGWVKSGPTGVIATTMADAFGTADAIAADWSQSIDSSGILGSQKDGWEGVQSQARSVGIRLRPVSWQDWLKIDRIEKENGKKQGKVREKIPSTEEMLKVLD